MRRSKEERARTGSAAAAYYSTLQRNTWNDNFVCDNHQDEESVYVHPSECCTSTHTRTHERSTACHFETGLTLFRPHSVPEFKLRMLRWKSLSDSIFQPTLSFRVHQSLSIRRSRRRLRRSDILIAALDLPPTLSGVPYFKHECNSFEVSSVPAFPKETNAGHFKAEIQRKLIRGTNCSLASSLENGTVVVVVVF